MLMICSQNIDLHALTGWIPERMAIKNDPTFNSDGLFEKLLTRMAKGDVLVTVATGELSDAEAERSGLVPTHAYAVLDIKKIKVCLIITHIFMISNVVAIVIYFLSIISFQNGPFKK